MVTLLSTLHVAACWAAPVPFEIFSDNRDKVFVFTPVENSFDNALAAVYEIINGERHLLYTVNDLSSFAYESNFHFSADMMHFARTFPGYGMPAFEVFSQGTRTRVVMRDDFIEDYSSVQSYTSIGPFYAVTWRIEAHSPRDNTIAITTTEGNHVIFDLAAARFDSEPIPPVYDETPVFDYPDAVVNLAHSEVSPAATTQIQHPEAPVAPVAESRNSPVVILVIVGSVAVVGAGAYLLIKRKKDGVK